MISKDTILIVDGDAARRETLELWLADQGYDLVFAADGSEALTATEQLSPDLILLDANVPGIDSLELCRQLRSAPFSLDIPVIMSLPREQREARPLGLEAGVDGFVSKPLDRTELLARIRAFVRFGHHCKEYKAEIVKRNRQLKTLQSVGATITSGVGLQQVLEAVAKEIAALLEMKACALYQWSRESRTSHLLARHGPAGWWKTRQALGPDGTTDLPTMEQVLAHARPLQVRDGQPGLNPLDLAYMQEAGIKFTLKVPMIFQAEVVGFVEVMDDQDDRRLTGEEVTIVQLLANQAAGAVENARLYETVRRHMAEVTTLNRISQVITSILDLRETLAIIADHAHWLLGVAAASVILYDEESGDMWFGAASGEGADFIRGKRLAKGLGIVDWVIQKGEPLVVPEVSKDPRFFDTWDKEMGFTTQSILCIPLRTKGRTIGAIEAINKASGPFDAEDLNLLTSMAASAAIAIENARLYEQAQQEISERKRAESELRKANRALRTLSECNETLVRAEGEPELLEQICRILVEGGGHHMAWVGFAEHDEGKTVRPMAKAGYDEGYLDRVQITWADTELGRGPTGSAIRTRKPRIVADIRTDPDFAPWRTEALRRDYASSIALPLIANGQTVGALTIYAKEIGAFDTEEVSLLKELANDLAFGMMALRTRADRDRAEAEIRRLYQEMKDHAGRLEETVTERTHELQAERDRTQAILEAVGEAVIVTGLDGTVQYLNPAAIFLTGFTSEEAMGQSPRLWLHDPQSARVYPVEPSAGESRRTRRADVVSRRRDGTLYDASMTVAPLFDSGEAGKVIGHVCVQRDVTPIKEAERLKDQFISNVSHELRTPLSVITLVSGNLDRLYDRLADDRRRKLIQDIRDHAQVLNDLVGDVLEISRIESGRISADRQRMDLVQVAHEEAEKQQPLAHRKSQSLQMSGVEELPVLGNDAQLRQVLRNLLNNAIKFTPDDGQITCECSVLVAGEPVPETMWPGSDSLAPGRWAAIRIVDTGIGIKQQDLARLFERFFRVETQGKIPGTGLGLSIAKELIEWHGGQIAAASTPGEGSIFALYLPLLEE
jgi:PAS domain S-box-containing protein